LLAQASAAGKVKVKSITAIVLPLRCVVDEPLDRT
jgi:hypothetical protein